MNAQAKPILIGITGNMGSGKSVLLEILRGEGHAVVSADRVAQEQLEQPDSLKQIKKRWGSEAVSKGRANRAFIAGIVFRQATELEFLNNLIHPKTLTALENIVETSRARHIFFEVPLLFEAGLQQCFDFIVLVRSDPERRIGRLMRRDNYSREQILARMAQQIGDDEKIELCDLVLENDGDRETFEIECRNFLQSIPGIRARDKIPFSQ
jgi:dephospho-CoA kinase